MADSDWKSTLISKLPEVFYIIVTLLGILIVVVAILGGIAYKNAIPTMDAPTRSILAGFGLAIVVLGLFLMKRSPSAALPNAKDYSVSIVNPRPGDRVTTVDVRGTIKKKLPTGDTLWVFRIYDDEQFWHCRQCSISESGEEWTARNCDIGASAIT